MENDIKDYLSKEEMEQMDTLIQRAKQRKERRKAAANGEMRFQYFQCQCNCINEPENAAERPWQETSHELEKLLREICQFCLKYGLCQCPDYRERREKKRDEAETLFDEDLPF